MAQNVLKSIVAGIVAVSFAAAAPAFAQNAAQPTGTDKEHHVKEGGKKDGAKKDGEHKKDGAKAEGAAIGQAAPAFKLTSTDGKEVSLSDYKGKIVVLEWFNPECPYIVKHHKINTTFNDLHKKYAGKDVVMLAINSSADGKQGSGKETNVKAAKDFKMEYPILLDPKGEVGKAYGAKTTPHCFVIGKDGVLAYAGAIDDDKSPETAGKTNYVAKAVDELLAGSSVSTASTKPYGCGVKY
jgi:peroxiredoxin